MAIDYQNLLNEAMLSIVKNILMHVQEKGLENEQSFYISFRTDISAVILSKYIKQRYPKEITIVLQHQFKNLKVFNEKFSINVAFGGVSETIEVPFSALTSFVDPLADFNLQFKRDKKENEFLLHKPKKDPDLTNSPSKKIAEIQLINDKPGKVISIDKFRKNIKK